MAGIRRTAGLARDARRRRRRQDRHRDYPQRAKSANLRRTPRATVCILSDEFNGAYVQVDGTAEVLDMPDAVESLVDYFRCISGEHSDWDEYRDAMRAQNKSLIRISIDSWGPIATGGFPPELQR